MKRIGIFGLMLLGLSAVAVAQDNQVSLADVVRQQKPTKKASRVITNDEIPSRPEEPATPDTTANSASGTANAPATGTVAAATPGAAASGKPAAAANGDSPEVAAIKGRLKEVTADELNLSSTIKDIQAHLNMEEDRDRRAVLSNMLQNQKRSLELRQNEKMELRRKLDDAQSKTK